MRVVLDSNVFISGLMIPQSIPGRIVAAWRSGQFDLILSEPMLSEISRVLSYPKISRRIRWDEEKIARYISLLRFEADIVNIDGISADVPKDPNDSPILATLIASKADCLVSGDGDLLSLSAQHPVLSPSGFIAKIL
ncbi:MAG: putative toxin-antitoxin system toxin component, PIN family [Sulfuricella sp.]|nr:putative toxin-antitoxin system toxin component, PIN family [Gammaproteobacteria bacterium]